MRTIRLLPFLALCLGLPVTLSADDGTPDGATKVALVFQGGHDTDPRDRGRPVALIAAALGVPGPVFREAFSHVHPAGPGQPPEDAQVRKNKQALMERLSPYGVTDERLNEVSNYYRYRSWAGELWRHVDAAGYAWVKGNKIVNVTITNPGAGYTTPPQVSIPGVALTVYPMTTLAYGTDLARNGSVKAVTLQPLGDHERILSGAESGIIPRPAQEIQPGPAGHEGGNPPPPPGPPPPGGPPPPPPPTN